MFEPSSDPLNPDKDFRLFSDDFIREIAERKEISFKLWVSLPESDRGLSPPFKEPEEGFQNNKPYRNVSKFKGMSMYEINRRCLGETQTK